MNLIDKDALAKMICKDQCDRKRADCDSDCEMVAYVTNAPTVDAVPVVRCKDCKHRRENGWYGEPGTPKYICELDTGDIFECGREADKDDWFCADGERRGKLQ